MTIRRTRRDLSPVPHAVSALCRGERPQVVQTFTPGGRWVTTGTRCVPTVALLTSLAAAGVTCVTVQSASHIGAFEVRALLAERVA